MQKANQKEQITPNKNQLNKQFFDSETNESSKKDINSSQASTNEKQYKKSIEFFPKQMNIEELNESEDVQRKYTIESRLIIKDFVPKLKPIEINLVPSKLRLNKKGIKDYKRNKNNKILLNSKKYFISCPNSEDEDSENYSSSKEILPFYENGVKEFSFKDEMNDSDINFTRKILQKTKKKNMTKVHSKNEVASKGKYENELNLGNSSDSDLYDIDEIDNYSLLAYEDKEDKKDNEEENGKYRERENSFSILEILRKKSQLDNE